MSDIDFGFFYYDFKNLRFKDSHELVPSAGYRVSQPTKDNGHTWGCEVVFPLENTCSAWLFGTRDKYWEVSMALWVPCPLHPNAGYTPDQCEMPAQWMTKNNTVVTHPANCAGVFCEGCFHDTNGINADPGTVDEFFDVLKHWGGLTYEQHPEDVLPHEDHLVWMKNMKRDLKWQVNRG